MTQFKRAYRIEFEGIDIKPITDLRIVFDADKSDGQQMNRCRLTIFNLRSSSRAALSKTRPFRTVLAEDIIKCFLYVGYEDNVKILIAGDIFFSNSVRQGTEWITTIELYSGITAATLANVKIDRDGKTSAKSISDAILAPLNLSVEYTEDAVDALKNQTFTDFSESGMALRSIKGFLNRFDLDFTIEDDGKGLVYKINTPRERGQTSNNENTFNINNGLIGSPNITRTGVEILSLVRPTIKLLQTFFVESQTINETLQQDKFFINKYYAKSVRHFGDSRDREWFTTIEGVYTDISDELYK